MAYYPTAIPNTTNYPNRTDDVDWIYAARYNEIKNEVIALCAELGISPSGASATVVARLALLALKSNVLELDNVDAFTPDADYEPATKKYVDDLIAAAISYSDTRFKSGSFTRDTSLASGSQEITGLGFAPKAIIFFSGQHDAVGEVCFGFTDGVAPKGIINIHNVSPNKWYTATNQIIDIHEAADKRYYGVLSSLDSNGFTIGWTKTGLPTGTLTINYLAFR